MRLILAIIAALVLSSAIANAAPYDGPTPSPTVDGVPLALVLPTVS